MFAIFTFSAGTFFESDFVADVLSSEVDVREEQRRRGGENERNINNVGSEAVKTKGKAENMHESYGGLVALSADGMVAPPRARLRMALLLFY